MTAADGTATPGGQTVAITPSRPGLLVGRGVKRVNDPKLLMGKGRFVDDLELPGMVHATILRSSVAAGTIRGASTEEAAAASGVSLVWHALDAPSLHDIPCVWLQPHQTVTSYPVLGKHVRYVGQPVGIVVAASRPLAEDAAGLVELEIQAAEPVEGAAHAVSEGAPLVYPALGTNVAVELVRGDPEAEVRALIASAPHVVEMGLRVQRVAGNPMETRGVVAAWDAATEHLTVWTSTQAVHHARDHIAAVLDLRADQVRVLAPDVGGAFGVKEHLYPDEVLVCAAAVHLGVPVKWVEDRAEHLTGTCHARDQLHQAVLALDDSGQFLALWSDFLHDLGAHPSNVGSGPSQVASAMLQGPYRVTRAGTHARCVVTNRTPTGAYRGFGMQQAAWVRERLVEEAARRFGFDPVDLRRRNMFRADELPTTTRFFQNYDNGDYVAALDRAAQVAADWPEPAEDGRRHGIGLASYVEFTGLGPTKDQQIVGFQLNGFETTVVRMEPDGSVTALTGVSPHGQGLETSLAQLVCDLLGVPIERVRVVHGDSDVVPYSAAGTIASRSMTVGGGSLVRSSEALRDKILRIAAHQLEADPADLELVEERAQVKGTPTIFKTMREVAQSAWLGWDLPEGEAPGLEARFTYDPPGIAYSYATHVAGIAIDVDTGVIEVERYAVVHDCGRIVNPMIVDGQIQGGVAQGLGIALLEEVLYGEGGQPAMMTFLDYLLPLSTDVPDVTVVHIETPSPFTPGGMKGLGEGGVIPTPAAVANAVAAAVPEIASRLTETPLSPPRVWSYLRDAGLAR